MGCNESKHAVATTNAISRRSFRKKSSSVKPKDSDTTIPQDIVPANQPAEQPDQLNQNDQNVANDVKNVNFTAETKDKVEDGSVVGGNDNAVDDYFSTKKDEDVAESEEGYYSPTRDPVKDGELTDEGERKEGDGKEEAKGEPVVQEEMSLAEEDDTTSLIKEDEKGKVEELKEPNSPKIVEEITVEPPEAPVVVAATATTIATAATPEESNNVTMSEASLSNSPVKEAEAEAEAET